MNPRALAALLGLAVLLFAFIVLFERNTLSTGDLEGREHRVLERFVRGRIERVAVVRDGRTTEVVRDLPRGAEPGPWRLTRPVQGKADQDAVERLLSAFEWAEPTRRLAAPNASDLRAFGLAPARLELRLQDATGTTTLHLGGVGPDGESAYARIDGARDVLLIGKDLRDAIEASESDLRSKELFAEPVGALTAITLRSSEGTTRIRLGVSPRVESPVAITASSVPVRAIVRSLGELRAKRFVGAGSVTPESAGLGAASIRVEADTEAGAARFVLELGVPCGDHVGERYARANDGPIVCVADDAVRAFTVAPDALEDRRLLPVENDEVESIAIENGESLSIARVGTGFHGRTSRAGHESEFPVDETAMADFLDALRHTRAVRLDPRSVPTTRGRVVARLEGGREVSVAFGEADRGFFPARRGDEALWLWFPAANFALLTPSPLHVRRGRLLDESIERIASIEIGRPDGTERIERATGAAGPRITSPVEVAADGPRVAELARSLAALEVVRFAAERAAPEHGLATPRLVVTDRLDAAGPLPAIRHDLRIGAGTDGGAFATLDDDPTVFVISGAFLALVEKPSASLDVFGTDAAFVSAIVVETDGASRRFTRENGTLRSEAGALDPAKAAEILRGIAELRAESAEEYGRFTPATGLARPTTRIRVERTAEAIAPREYVVRVGATEGEGDDATVFIARDDLAIAYRAPAALLTAILNAAR